MSWGENMEILYYQSWFRYKKIPRNPLEEEVAQQYHGKGKPYVAVVSEGGSITHVIEVGKTSVHVLFMDLQGDNYLSYDFQRKNEDDVFLSAAYYYEYEVHEMVENIMFSFHENGELIMAKWDSKTGNLEESEAMVDVACNWDKYPEFGEYSRLLQEERERINATD